MIKKQRRNVSSIEYSTPYMPKDKVRYLMGVGDPIDLIEGVIRE